MAAAAADDVQEARDARADAERALEFERASRAADADGARAAIADAIKAAERRNARNELAASAAAKQVVAMQEALDAADAATADARARFAKEHEMMNAQARRVPVSRARSVGAVGSTLDGE